MAAAAATLRALPEGWEADSGDREGASMTQTLARAWPIDVTGAAAMSLLALAELALPGTRDSGLAVLTGASPWLTLWCRVNYRELSNAEESGMGEPAPVASQPGDAEELAAHVSAVRTRVRRDLRATSLPLLLLGAATAAGTVLQLVAPDSGWPLPGGDWLTAVLITVAFAVMWLVFRRRALRGGVGRPAGFGAAAVLGLCFTVSVGLIAMIFAGPFVVFGAGLLVAGIWQRNRFLAGWAVLIGGTGVFEGFFGITNRLPASVWRDWEHPAIYLVLAMLTVLAGLIARSRENRTR